MATNEYDYVIVGGGTAGCALASRLSQMPSRGNERVCVIEWGRDERNNSAILNRSGAPVLQDLGLNVEYRTKAQQELKGRSIVNQAGRLVSGSSGVNASHWSRGTKEDFHEWARIAGHDRFEFENLLPYFKRSETHFEEGTSISQGTAGPVHTQPGRYYPLRDCLREALIDAGYCENLDPFDESIRQRSGYVYDLSNVTIISGIRARRILFEQRDEPVAVGIELEDRRKIMSRCEIIISAGGHCTPQILMLSGIGPRNVLESCSIPILVDSPHVGKNQWDHIRIYQFWKLRDPLKGQAMFSPNFPQDPSYGRGGPVDWSLRYYIKDKIRLAAALEADKIQEPAIDAYMDLSRSHIWNIWFYVPFAASPAFSQVKMDGSHILTATVLLMPTSRGTLSLNAEDPEGDRILDPKYLSTESDRVSMVHGLRQMAELMGSPALRSEVEGETPPDGFKAISDELNDDEVLERIANFADILHHCSGTASLGRVTDSEFRVKGCQRLRVVDASVFPAPVTGFPQTAVYAIAELASELIIQSSNEII